MDILYKIFDKFTNMIPDNVQQTIRLGALLAWVILATIVIYISWSSGVDSAPELGQELSLSNIKEQIAREQNIKKVGDVVLPDLNDLIRERYQENVKPVTPSKRAQENPLAEIDQNTIETVNPVRSYNNKNSQQTGLVFQGNNLTPYTKDSYVPLKDAGAGGSRESTIKDSTLNLLPTTNQKQESKNIIKKTTTIKPEKKSTKKQLPYFID